MGQDDKLTKVTNTNSTITNKGLVVIRPLFFFHSKAVIREFLSL